MRTTALPTPVVIDRMQAMINGSHVADPGRRGHLDRDRAQTAIEMFKASFDNPLPMDAAMAKSHEELRKDVTLADGLAYYDLRAPALNLFPTVTPLRNAIPRNQRPNPGDAAHWKAIVATTGSGFPFMGWVPEGRRSGSMSYTVEDKSLTYKTIGEEDSLTDEARQAAMGFEDEDSLVQLRLMLKMFVKEEAGLLGGNNSLTVSAPSAPTVSAGGSGKTLPSATYVVYCVALTQEGYQNSNVTDGVATRLTITGNDGKTFVLNGGSSNKSSASSGQAVTLGQYLRASVPVVNGAVAYAWFVGTAGNETLQAITTINSVEFDAPLESDRQAATEITADNSKNTLAFDGILTTGFSASAAGNAYIATMADGTAGTGTGLTASGAGGIVEIDNMLQQMWELYRISPTVIYVNSQELRNITAKVLSNGSAPLLRYNVEADQAGMVEYKLTAAGVVSFYFNPYTADGGSRIPIKIHPNLAPGTILAWAETLPPWYVSNNTPNVAEVLTRRDYYTEAWARTTRAQYYGVYSQEALAVYAPFAIGMIRNIADA